MPARDFTQLYDVPTGVPVLERIGRVLFDSQWLTWFVTMRRLLNACARVIATVSLTTQGASIGATALPTGTLKPGLYRVSYYARISRAATTSSSLTVTVGFTHGGVACTIAGSAMTGNTTATVQTGTMLVKVDQNTSLTYATTYASVGGTSMQYALDVIAELIP